MKTDKPENNSGKTRFNRNKPKGVSWIDLREAAIKAGTFRRSASSSSGHSNKKQQ